MMKHFNLILTTLFLLFLVSVAYAAPAGSRQEQMTYKTQLHVIHQHFGVNFVYDSALDLDIPYKGRPMPEVIRRDGAYNDEETLLKCLETLFQESDITYEVKRKYVVLTRKSSRKAPKDYTILVEEQRDTLQESVVTAMTDPKRNSTQTGYMRIDTRKLNRGFALFSTPDVIKTLQTLPGVSSGTELLSGFYVHGGDGTDNLYLLDGVPIYQVSHMLGLFSSFNTDVISSLDFYKSGFPARYGSKLSSVVDVNTKDGAIFTVYGFSFYCLWVLDTQTCGYYQLFLNREPRSGCHSQRHTTPLPHGRKVFATSCFILLCLQVCLLACLLVSTSRRNVCPFGT